MLLGGRGDTLAHAFSKNYVHVIFSTKGRRQIVEKELQPRLRAWHKYAASKTNSVPFCAGMALNAIRESCSA